MKLTQVHLAVILALTIAFSGLTANAGLITCNQTQMRNLSGSWGYQKLLITHVPGSRFRPGWISLDMAVATDQVFFISRFDQSSRSQVVYEDGLTKIIHSSTQSSLNCQIDGEERVIDKKTGALARLIVFRLNYEDFDISPNITLSITNLLDHDAGANSFAFAPDASSVQVSVPSHFPKPNFAGTWVEPTSGDVYTIEQGAASINIVSSNPAHAFASPYFDGTGADTQASFKVGEILVHHRSDWWGDIFYGSEYKTDPLTNKTTGGLFYLQMKDSTNTTLLFQYANPKDPPGPLIDLNLVRK